MRIGIYTEIYKPVLNGVVVSVEAFRQGLTALGHEVWIFTPAFMRYPDDRVVTFHSCPIPTGGPYRLTLPFLSGRRPLPRLDVIHAQSPFMTGLLAWRHARRHAIPLIFTYHTRLVDYSHYVPLPNLMVRRFLVQVSRLYGNLADRVLAPSEPIRQLLHSYHVETPIDVLPSPVRLAPIDRARVTEIRSRAGLDADDVLLLNVGRLAREKNLETLLEIFSRLRQRFPSRLKLAVVGDGPQEQALRSRAEALGCGDAVIFAGRIERSDIPAWYAAANLFVFTSLTETQGLVLEEALQVGLPVVAFAEGGVVDVLSRAPGTLAVTTEGSPAAQVERFTAALMRLLENPGEMQAFKLAARAGICRDPNDLESSRRLLAIYQAAIVDAASRPPRQARPRDTGTYAHPRP